MAALLATIKDTVRGIVVDRVEAGVTPFFSDDELLVAINITKNEFFARRPEAFCNATILLEPPVDLTGIDTSLAINPWAVSPFCFGVAYHLLSQRGKDAFYRKAAQEVLKKYTQE